MNFTKSKKTVKSLLVIALLLIVLAFSGCNTQQNTTDITTAEVAVTTIDDSAPERISLGEGKNSFLLDVIFGNDISAKYYSINTNKETVGDALLELELIEGEPNNYGLYIKTVDGVIADYETDGTYWAFYINGKYAASAVDATEIEAGATYKLEKTA